MDCANTCACLWCSFYISYCCCFCGSFIQDLYNERVQRYEQIKQEYDEIPHQQNLNVEMKIERLITTPLSTIEEEPEGYQDFRLQQ